MTPDEAMNKFLDESAKKYVSSIATNILDYHRKEPIKELTDFASQAVEDYKEKLKAELDKKVKQLEDDHDGDPWYNGAITELTEFKKLIDSIK